MDFLLRLYILAHLAPDFHDIQPMAQMAKFRSERASGGGIEQLNAPFDTRPDCQQSGLSCKPL